MTETTSAETEPQELSRLLGEHGIDAPAAVESTTQLSKAVRAFQELAGLPVTGNLTEAVKQRLRATPVLKRGSLGPSVQHARWLLRGRGVRVQVIDTFDTALEHEVREYQGRIGLPRTGQIDAATWAALQER